MKRGIRNWSHLVPLQRLQLFRLQEKTSCSHASAESCCVTQLWIFSNSKSSCLRFYGHATMPGYTPFLLAVIFNDPHSSQT